MEQSLNVSPSAAAAIVMQATSELKDAIDRALRTSDLITLPTVGDYEYELWLIAMIPFQIGILKHLAPDPAVSVGRAVLAAHTDNLLATIRHGSDREVVMDDVWNRLTAYTVALHESMKGETSFEFVKLGTTFAKNLGFGPDPLVSMRVISVFVSAGSAANELIASFIGIAPEQPDLEADDASESALFDENAPKRLVTMFNLAQAEQDPKQRDRVLKDIRLQQDGEAGDPFVRWWFAKSLSDKRDSVEAEGDLQRRDELLAELRGFEPVFADTWAAFTKPQHDWKGMSAFQRQLAANREWDRTHRKRDPEKFRRDILPGLAGVPLQRLAEVTGLSKAECSKIRRGRKVPHPRHWEGLRNP